MGKLTALAALIVLIAGNMPLDRKIGQAGNDVLAQTAAAAGEQMKGLYLQAKTQIDRLGSKKGPGKQPEMIEARLGRLIEQFTTIAENSSKQPRPEVNKKSRAASGKKSI